LRNVFSAALMLALSASLLLIGTLSLDFCTKNGATGQIAHRGPISVAPINFPIGNPISLGPQVSIVAQSAFPNDTQSMIKNTNGTSAGNQNVAPLQSGPVFTNVSVMPNNLVVLVGQTFSVEVWINNVTDMAGWEITLFWNSSLLRCIQAQVNTPPEWGGAGLNFFGLTEADAPSIAPNAVYNAWQFGSGVNNSYNAVYGRYDKCEVMGPNGGPYDNTFNGSYAIVTFTFQALQAGSTSLDPWKGEMDGIGDEHSNLIAFVDYSGSVKVQDLASFEAADQAFLNRLGTARADKLENGTSP
jgi:hypothetical protein